jgi:hypothetical protein
MTNASISEADEAIGLDDYVACTIEGRVIGVSETHDGKKYLVEFFDNHGARRVRNLWRDEVALEDEPVVTLAAN